MKKFDILICGVGGQGIILCSNIIGNAGVIEGLPVKGSEIHGMSQRGGSVEAHVRLNCKLGPVIPKGQADLIIGFEPLESVRYLNFLKPDGIAVVNSFPIPIYGLKYEYEEIIEILKTNVKNLYIENFTSIAESIGSIKILNVLMLGFSSKFIPLKKKSFIEAMKVLIPSKYFEINLKAFNYFEK
ncbi:MAG: indolepyruvate oxidoreductase subunit beta [Candidatus Omnitrophica bacterium]|nr:indolepyruvate oxidoreductase subunit beta [Candidatus Omnitrophota bacterium]MCM8806501.1 indolepyruvate oxidoreductase subunit beta [Candidatus Omnitrophota bacterium]